MQKLRSVCCKEGKFLLPFCIHGIWFCAGTSYFLPSCHLVEQQFEDQYDRTKAENLSYLKEHQAPLRASDFSILGELPVHSGRLQ